MKAKLPKRLNAGEELFAQQLRAYRIPFEREVVFSPPRKWRFDFLLPCMVAVEIEGGIYTAGRHTRISGFIADMEKYNAAAIAGYSVLRYSPDQIKTGNPINEVIAFLRSMGGYK